MKERTRSYPSRHWEVRPLADATASAVMKVAASGQGAEDLARELRARLRASWSGLPARLVVVEDLPERVRYLTPSMRLVLTQTNAWLQRWLRGNAVLSMRVVERVRHVQKILQSVLESESSQGIGFSLLTEITRLGMQSTRLSVQEAREVSALPALPAPEASVLEYQLIQPDAISDPSTLALAQLLRAVASEIRHFVREPGDPPGSRAASSEQSSVAVV